MRGARSVERHSATALYFAEGATAVCDLYYLLLNPGSAAVKVTRSAIRLRLRGRITATVYKRTICASNPLDGSHSDQVPADCGSAHL